MRTCTFGAYFRRIWTKLGQTSSLGGPLSDYKVETHLRELTKRESSHRTSLRKSQKLQIAITRLHKSTTDLGIRFQGELDVLNANPRYPNWALKGVLESDRI